MGRGGYKTGGGRHVKFNPYEKGGGGAEKVLSMLMGGGGHNKFWGSFYTIVLGVRKKFPLFEKSGARSFTLS